MIKAILADRQNLDGNWQANGTHFSLLGTIATKSFKICTEFKPPFPLRYDDKTLKYSMQYTSTLFKTPKPLSIESIHHFEEMPFQKFSS